MSQRKPDALEEKVREFGNRHYRLGYAWGAGNFDRFSADKAAVEATRDLLDFVRGEIAKAAIPAALDAHLGWKLTVGQWAVCSRGRVGRIEGQKELPWGLSWVGTGIDGEPWASRDPLIIPNDVAARLVLAATRAALPAAPTESRETEP